MFSGGRLSRLFVGTSAMIVLVVSCAGPERELARQRFVKWVGLKPVLHSIDQSQYGGPDVVAAIEASDPGGDGNAILRDKVLIDVTVADSIRRHGSPDFLEFVFSDSGQTNWLAVYYLDPEATRVFRKSIGDVQWLSFRQLHQSQLVMEVAAVPRHVRAKQLDVDLLAKSDWTGDDCRGLEEILDTSQPRAPIERHPELTDFGGLADDIRKPLPRTSNIDLQRKADEMVARLRPSTTDAHLGWKIEVVGVATPVAFGIPDGSLIVTEELADVLDDDQLAAVIAHLMGHEWYRHGRERALKHVSREHLQIGDPPPWLKNEYVYRIASHQLGYTKLSEAEANEAAVRILRGAGIPEDALYSAMATIDRSFSGAGRKPSVLFKDMHGFPESLRDLGLRADCGELGEAPN